MLFFIIYTNNDYKQLMKTKKPEISQNKFEKPAFVKSYKIFQKEKKKRK